MKKLKPAEPVVQLPASSPAPQKVSRLCLPSDITTHQVLLAQLAAQFLPKLELPEKWEVMEPTQLSRLIRAATDTSVKFPDLPMSMPGIEKPFTAFEVIAEVAVERAWIVFLAAYGYKRPARLALAKAYNTKIDEGQKWHNDCIKWQNKFIRKITNLGKDTISLIDAIAIVLPNSNAKMRCRHLITWLEKGTGELGKKEAEAAMAPASRPLNEEQFTLMAIGLHRFYEQYGATVTKAVQRKSGQAGGQKSATKRQSAANAETAKYGEGALGGTPLGKRDEQRLKKANQKATAKKNPRKRPSRKLPVDRRK